MPQWNEDCLYIEGGRPLSGEVKCSGSKNTALPMIASSLLCEGRMVIHHTPHLTDVFTMCELVRTLGVDIEVIATRERDGQSIALDGTAATKTEASYRLVRAMRASILVLGPLLARQGRCSVPLPGGCAIGTRPVNQHLDAMRALGAEISIEAGCIGARAPRGGLKGAEFVLDMPSFTATENAILAASVAHGQTIIHNIAREPEIDDLIASLVSCGAKITKEGEQTVVIDGVSRLHGGQHTIASDRIEAATFMLAIAATRGHATIGNVDPNALTFAIEALRRTGAEVIADVANRSVTVNAVGRTLRAHGIETGPHPGFPTDVQAQYAAFCTTCEGSARIHERMFESRFGYVAELNRMGAGIEVSGSVATVTGPRQLSGTRVKAGDLRASASLVIAGLAARGLSVVERIEYIDRGYEMIEYKFQQLGAQIDRRVDADASSAWRQRTPSADDSLESRRFSSGVT